MICLTYNIDYLIYNKAYFKSRALNRALQGRHIALPIPLCPPWDEYVVQTIPRATCKHLPQIHKCRSREVFSAQDVLSVFAFTVAQTLGGSEAFRAPPNYQISDQFIFSVFSSYLPNLLNGVGFGPALTFKYPHPPSYWDFINLNNLCIHQGFIPNSTPRLPPLQALQAASPTP